MIERHRVGFRKSLEVAWRTGALFWGAVPVTTAVWWWMTGVPDDKLRLADEPLADEPSVTPPEPR